jgi:hypothetical protein
MSAEERSEAVGKSPRTLKRQTTHSFNAFLLHHFTPTGET